MTLAIAFLVMVLLLLVKGFFSGSEIALVSADRVKLRYESAQGDRGAELAQNLLRDPARLLTTTLLGTNISSTALVTIGTLLMVGLLGSQGEFIALLVFTPLFLILGEIVPKSIYQQKANALVPVIAYPLSWLQTILAPLVWFFSLIAKFVAQALGGGADEAAAAREQFLAAVRMAEKGGTAEAFSGGQVRNVLRVAAMNAGEAMYPMSEVRSFRRDTDMSELVAFRREDDQRLIPLYDEAPDKITSIAVIESWDLLDPEIGARKVEDYLGAMRCVDRSTRVSDIIDILHAEPDLTVVVTGGEGVAAGLITLRLLVRGTLGVAASPLTDRLRPKAQDGDAPKA